MVPLFPLTLKTHSTLDPKALLPALLPLLDMNQSLVRKQRHSLS